MSGTPTVLRFRAHLAAAERLRRVHLEADLDAEVEQIIGSHKSALALLALALLAGHITRAAFIEKATALLTSGIQQAAVAAGTPGQDAAALAEKLLAAQQQRLDSLATALDDATLPTEETPGSGISVAAGRLRAGLLAGAIWAGYQAAKTIGGDDDAQFAWRCKEDQASCEDCTANADGSPYNRDDLPGYPGDGGTQCGGNCRCRVVRV